MIGEGEGENENEDEDEGGGRVWYNRPGEREENRMCLGIPGRVTEKYETSGMAMGKVDFGGITKEVCLAYVPEIEIGDYTIVHVGFAISRLDEESAQETLRIFQEMGRLEEELGDAADGHEVEPQMNADGRGFSP